MHKSQSGMGSSDHTGSWRGAVGKFSSASLSESPAGWGESLKFSHLWTTQCSEDFTWSSFWSQWRFGYHWFSANLWGWRKLWLLMVLSRCGYICWAAVIGHTYHQFCSLHCGGIVPFQISSLKPAWMWLKEFGLAYGPSEGSPHYERIPCKPCWGPL